MLPKKKPNPLKPKKISNYQRGPLWDWTKGITQSGLENFLACREQFALGYIEGWTSRAFSTPLEFGSLFHFMLEKIGTAPPEDIAREVCKSYHDARKKTLKGDHGDLQLALTNAETLFPLYVAYYQERDSKLQWLQREHVFKIDHWFTIPNRDPQFQQKITLTGMRDGEYRNIFGGLGLFETKTKSNIDDIAIQDGLRADLQTMLYLLSLRREYREEPSEILYNVVRRPQLRLKVNETLVEYGKRLREDISSRPDWYFRSYEVTVSPGDIDCFVETTLDPVLRCLLQWWDSISANPLSRWGSPYHYRNLSALMTRYGKCQLYNLMILGRKSEYYQRSSPFPELKEFSSLQVA